MRIAPDSKTAKSPASRSTMVGMRPFGLSFTYSGRFWSPASRFTRWTSYGSPSSSSATDAFQPFGVGAVYRSMDIVRGLSRAAPSSSRRRLCGNRPRLLLGQLIHDDHTALAAHDRASPRRLAARRRGQRSGVRLHGALDRLRLGGRRPAAGPDGGSHDGGR